MINITKLKALLPEFVYNSLEECSNKFLINTELRISHFLSQCMHESAGFKIVNENLYYSASRLKQIFPKYFPDNLAESYAMNPVKIASRAYGNRMGNGSEESTEGYKFRGRGYIQLTGKNNYTAFGNAINENIISNPDIVSTPKYALLSAAWFWDSNKLNTIADTGSSIDVVKKITIKVNGGVLGLNDRFENFNKIYNLLISKDLDIGKVETMPLQTL